MITMMAMMAKGGGVRWNGQRGEKEERLGVSRFELGLRDDVVPAAGGTSSVLRRTHQASTLLYLTPPVSCVLFDRRWLNLITMFARLDHVNLPYRHYNSQELSNVKFYHLIRDHLRHGSLFYWPTTAHLLNSTHHSTILPHSTNCSIVLEC